MQVSTARTHLQTQESRLLLYCQNDFRQGAGLGQLTPSWIIPDSLALSSTKDLSQNPLLLQPLFSVLQTERAQDCGDAGQLCVASLTFTGVREGLRPTSVLM